MQLCFEEFSNCKNWSKNETIVFQQKDIQLNLLMTYDNALPALDIEDTSSSDLKQAGLIVKFIWGNLQTDTCLHPIHRRLCLAVIKKVSIRTEARPISQSYKWVHHEILLVAKHKNFVHGELTYIPEGHLSNRFFNTLKRRPLAIPPQAHLTIYSRHCGLLKRVNNNQSGAHQFRNFFHYGWCTDSCHISK